MDGQPDGPMRGSMNFCKGGGGGPGPTTRIQDPYMGYIHTCLPTYIVCTYVFACVLTYVRTYVRTYVCIHPSTDVYDLGYYTSLIQTDRHTCIEGKLKQINRNTDTMSETYMRVHVEAYMRGSLSFP